MATKTHVLEILQVAPWHLLFRPCVDCGLRTGCWCDGCFGAYRFPEEEWDDKQHTPLCTSCDNKYGCCHYCRGQRWATPPPHGPSVPIMSQADTRVDGGPPAFETRTPGSMHGDACLPVGDASPAGAPLVAPEEGQTIASLPGVIESTRVTANVCFGSWYDGFIQSYVHNVDVQDKINRWKLTVRT